jgi:hypothetical protein
VTRPVTVIVLLALALGATAWRLADTKPDPNTQAIADGCQRDTTKIYTGAAPNWVYVNDRDFPSAGPPPSPRWVNGTVKGPLGLLASRVASSDDPITHRSYDVNLDVTVQRADDFLTGTSRDATSEQGTLHLERESSSYPEWARPQAGDHVEALGSWIWDCDHYQGRGEKTEFHPFRAVWVARRGVSPRSEHGHAEGDLYISSDPTPAGKQAECSHRVKGSDQFKACSHSAREWWSVNGTYRFVLCAPGPKPPRDHLAVAMVNKGSITPQHPAVTPRSDGCADVTLKVDEPDGRRVVAAWQFFVGWSKSKLRVDHLRLHFDRLLVRRAMDPSCAPDKPACPAKSETTLLGQIAKGPGEWQLHWSVDGIWGRWPGTLAAHDGSVFKGRQSVDFFVEHGQPWSLVTLARECDFGALPGWDGPGHPTAPCPVTTEIGNSEGDDYPGAITVTTRGPGLGRHVANASTAGSSCPPSNRHGCYQLTYTVTRVH